MTIDKDIWAGLFFASLGALGLYLGADYTFGTTAKMGAGFLPKLLCWCLVGLGGLIFVTGAVRRGEGTGEWELRPLIFVLAAVLVFAALIETVGLIAATMGMTLVAAMGSKDTRWLEMIIVGSLMGAVSVLVFVKGLGLTIKIFPGM